MDSQLYKAAWEGNVDILKSIVESDIQLLQSVTPQGYTALHIAARLGHKHFAEEILQKFNTLLITKNAEEDTPLHVAARVGHLEMAKVLARYGASWPTMVESEQGPLRMTNNQGNTPLHMAVKHRHSEIALELLREDVRVGHIMNCMGETPLHIAAKEGLENVVTNILERSLVEEEEELLPADNRNGSPLHQAVIGAHISIVKLLLEKRPEYIKVVDSSCNNALHYASHCNNGKMFEILLNKEHFLAYAQNIEGKTPLHVAAAFGSTSAIKELLKYCPDSAEQVDFEGKNAIHIAVMSRTLYALKCLLKYVKPEEIINQPDACGDTPLHLAAKQSRTQSSIILMSDKRVNPCILNKEGKTARNVIESLDDANFHNAYIAMELKKKEQQRYEKRQMPKDGISYSFRGKKIDSKEHFKLSVETYTLVSALIATVTFSATFTMPGGYNQMTGIAILGKRAAFKVFVLSNSIAMCFSLVVMFCFIWAWKVPVHFKLNQLIWGHRLTVVSCLSMIVSLMSAVYLVVEEESLWLAIAVALIGSSIPFLVWAILGHEILFIPI